MKKRISAIILALFLLLSLVSCGASYDKAKPDDFVYYDGNGYYSEAYDMAPVEEAETTASYYGSSTGGKTNSRTEHTENNDLSARKIIKNADLNFQTKDYDGFLDSFKQKINEYDGYIERSDISGGGAYDSRYTRNATIKVRIPAERYDSFMDTVVTLGSLKHRYEYIDDVTLRYVDIESRIKAYETEYDALLELLAKAESVDAIIQLRTRISEIQYELESYKSQLRKYDDLISYCTINIYVEEVRVETVSQDKMTVGERIVAGISKTFYDIGVWFEDFLVGLVTALPYLVIIAVIILIIVIIIKSSIKKHRKKREKKIKSENENKENKENKE